MLSCVIFFFFQAEDGIRDLTVTGVQTCALPISSMPRLDAASISTRASAEPPWICTHDAHSLHGSDEPDSRRRQLIALASRRAVVVLPVPRVPENRYAWATRSVAMAPRSARAVASWPTRSPKLCERYLR